MGEPGLGGLLAGVCEALVAAADVAVEGVGDEALGAAVAERARIESRAVALRMSLSTEADRRQVARATAETGTDMWVVRLTGSTRAQAAGGLRIARLTQLSSHAELPYPRAGTRDGWG